MRRNRGTMRGMGSISRYIFWRTFGAFLVVLGGLTAVIWVTQAVYDIDLMRSPGQAILIFFGITGRIIPLLSAPIALMIAVATAFGANIPWLLSLQYTALITTRGSVQRAHRAHYTALRHVMR